MKPQYIGFLIHVMIPLTIPKSGNDGPVSENAHNKSIEKTASFMKRTMRAWVEDIKSEGLWYSAYRRHLLDMQKYCKG